jgi:hypothetical protein
MRSPSIEFVADEDPLAMLDTLVDLATPAFAQHGYAVEGRGADWAHWERGFEKVIRAYAFRTETCTGVSVLLQGDFPAALPQELVGRITDATGWKVAAPF